LKQKKKQRQEHKKQQLDEDDDDSDDANWEDLMKNFESYEKYISFILDRERQQPTVDIEAPATNPIVDPKLAHSAFLQSACSRLHNILRSAKFHHIPTDAKIILNKNEFETLCRLSFPHLGAQNVKFADVEVLVERLNGRIWHTTGSIDQVWIPPMGRGTRRIAVWHRSHTGSQSGMGYCAAAGVRRVLRHFDVYPEEFMETRIDT
jgi:hypothetical protein